MLSMEDLKREQKSLDGILAILCVLCVKFFMILQPEGKILFKLQAVICIPFSFVNIDGLKISRLLNKLWKFGLMSTNRSMSKL